MNRNILYTGKKRYYWPGGPTDKLDPYWKPPTSIGEVNMFDVNSNRKYGLNNDFSINTNNNRKYGLNFDFTKNETGKYGIDTGSSVNLGQDKLNKANKFGTAIQGAIQLGQTAVNGLKTGNNNTNQGMYDTSIGVSDATEKDANNVTNTYTAGMNQMNLMSKTGNGNVSARDLKTHKGWKNILGSTGKGAAAGASVGSVILPGMGTVVGGVIGGVVGGIASGIGELFGWRKRKKQAEEMNRKKREADYAVDYYNSKQAEQLQSANDNAAHSMANQNRYSILGLMARGGRRNCLINNKHNRLC